jgi:hypothetical protein
MFIKISETEYARKDLERSTYFKIKDIDNKFYIGYEIDGEKGEFEYNSKSERDKAWSNIKQHLMIVDLMGNDQ